MTLLAWLLGIAGAAVCAAVGLGVVVLIKARRARSLERAEPPPAPAPATIDLRPADVVRPLPDRLRHGRDRLIIVARRKSR